MIRAPKKGSVVWVSARELIPESMPALRERFAELSVGIEHVGPNAAALWGLRLQAVRQQELRRLAELRRGLRQEEAPELWADDGAIITEEGFAHAIAASQSILAECVAGVRGVEGYDGVTDRGALVELLQMLGMDQFAVQFAVRVQNLSAQQVFTADPSNVGSDRSASAGGCS